MSKINLSFPKNRLRRMRQSAWIRDLVEENKLSSDDLIWPIFVCDGENKKEEIDAMPNAVSYTHLTLPTNSLV